jgi:DNA-binding MarR family transcriptional regulator
MLAAMLRRLYTYDGASIRHHSRRTMRRRYLPQRMNSQELRTVRRAGSAREAIAFRDDGATRSALHRRLRAEALDAQLARLVVVFEAWQPLCVADVAWRLGVSDATASRQLDRAERAGLIDKFYNHFDRRKTMTRLTRPGLFFRARVSSVLQELEVERPEGVSKGIRYYLSTKPSMDD